MSIRHPEFCALVEKVAAGHKPSEHDMDLLREYAAPNGRACAEDQLAGVVVELVCELTDCTPQEAWCPRLAAWELLFFLGELPLPRPLKASEPNNRCERDLAIGGELEEFRAAMQSCFSPALADIEPRLQRLWFNTLVFLCESRISDRLRGHDPGPVDRDGYFLTAVSAVREAHDAEEGGCDGGD